MIQSHNEPIEFLKLTKNTYFLPVLIFSLVIISTLFVFSLTLEEKSNDMISQNFQISDTDILKIQSLSIPFVKNTGQLNSDVLYLANIFAGTIFVTNNDFTYILNTENLESKYVLKETFSNKSLEPMGLDKSNTVINYFKGPQDNWNTNVPTFDTIGISALWNNIDLNVKAYGNNVEKIFKVKSGGIVSDIQVTVDGVSKLAIQDDKLVFYSLENGKKLFDMTVPIAYQIIDGQKYFIPVQYDVTENNVYGFKTGNYDKKYELFIDPLIASTFLGGSTSDVGNGIAIDTLGNVFVVGQTFTATTDLPTTTGSYDESFNGGTGDIFISKFDSSLSTLSASTFLGGSTSDVGNGIVIDTSGNVFVTGGVFSSSPSTNFPITSGLDNSLDGLQDAFVSKLNNDLSTLSASTFLGGSKQDTAHAIDIDTSGNVFVTGITQGGTFPTNNGVGTTFGGGSLDAFVSKFDSNLVLQASTFHGGSGSDIANAIAIDSAGNVFVTGLTEDATTDLTITSGAYDTTHNGGTTFQVGSFGTVTKGDAFVSKFTNNLSTLSASTFLGGSGSDMANAIIVNGTGSVFVTGWTEDASTDLPTTTGAYDTTHNGGTILVIGSSNNNNDIMGGDIFVSKLNNNLTTLQASTFLGGSDIDVGNAIGMDTSGNVFVTGWTADASTDLPTTTGAYDTTHNGGQTTLRDTFVSKFNNDLTKLSASTFLGGSGNDVGRAIIVNGTSGVFVTGKTFDSTTDLPTTTGAYDKIHNTGSDTFVSKFSNDLKLDPDLLQIHTKSGSTFLSGAKYTITPNPFTTASNDSLDILDNDNNDSDVTDGIIDIASSKSGRYTITQTVSPSGFTPTLKTTIQQVTSGKSTTTVVFKMIDTSSVTISDSEPTSSTDAPELDNAGLTKLKSFTAVVVDGNTSFTVGDTKDLPEIIVVGKNNAKGKSNAKTSQSSVKIKNDVSVGTRGQAFQDNLNLPVYTMPDNKELSVVLPAVVTEETSTHQIVSTPTLNTIIPGQTMFLPVETSLIPDFGGLAEIEVTTKDTSSSTGDTKDWIVVEIDDDIGNRPSFKSVGLSNEEPQLLVDIKYKFEEAGTGFNYGDENSHETKPKLTVIVPKPTASNVILLANGCGDVTVRTFENNSWDNTIDTVLSNVPWSEDNSFCEVVFESIHWSTKSVSFQTSSSSTSNGGGSSGDNTPPAFVSNFISSPTSTNYGGFLILDPDQPLHVQSFEVGETVKFEFEFDENSGTGLEYFELHLDVRDFQTIYESGLHIEDPKGKPLVIFDDNEFLKDVDILIDGTTNPKVIVSMIFEKPMDTSDVIIRTWDVKRNSIDIRFENVVKIIEPIVEKINLIEPDVLSEHEIIHDPTGDGVLENVDEVNILTSESTFSYVLFDDWAGYSQNVLSDKVFLEHVGLDGVSIPKWFKQNHTKWLKNDLITKEEFLTCLKYMDTVGII